MRGLMRFMGRHGVWRGLFRCERGATAIEYGLIIALIFLAIVGAVSSVADKTIGMWDHVETEVTAH